MKLSSLQLAEDIGWGVQPYSLVQIWNLQQTEKNLHFIWQLQGRSKFEFKFQLLNTAAHLAITPNGCSRRQSKLLSTKSMAELLWQCSSTASEL